MTKLHKKNQKRKLLALKSNKKYLFVSLNYLGKDTSNTKQTYKTNEKEIAIFYWAGRDNDLADKCPDQL